MPGLFGGSKSSPSPPPLPPPKIPRRKTDRPYRILSLDGGGVRGYSALLILSDFMLRVQLHENLGDDIAPTTAKPSENLSRTDKACKKCGHGILPADMPSEEHAVLSAGVTRREKSEKVILPADFFDLIIGTSTGGILALMLGRLRMSVEECIAAYQNLSSKIFGGGPANTVLTAAPLGFKLGLGILDGRGIDNFFNGTRTAIFSSEPALYSAKRFETHVKAAIKSQPHTRDREDALLEEDTDNCFTVIVAARDTNAVHPHLMRSYVYPREPMSHKVRIWEAARATSAAPTFFAPIEIGREGVKYIDGAVSGHCNPAALARQEAERLWPKRKNGLFLSLGTGSPHQVSLSGNVHKKLTGFIGLSSNTIQIEQQTRRFFNDVHKKDKTAGDPYVRLSVEHSIDGIRMDDCNKMSEIASATEAYLKTEVAMQNLDRAVELAFEHKKKGGIEESPSAAAPAPGPTNNPELQVIRSENRPGVGFEGNPEGQVATRHMGHKL